MRIYLYYSDKTKIKMACLKSLETNMTHLKFVSSYYNTFSI